MTELALHRALADTECTGHLHIDLAETGRMLMAECDTCGQSMGVRQDRVDREAAFRDALERSRLPASYVDKPYERHDGNTDAVRLMGLWTDKFDTANDGSLAGVPRPETEPHTLSARGDIDNPRDKLPPMLVGPPGIGKTHLIVRGAAALLRKGVRVQYWTMADLLDEAKRRMDSSEYQDRDVFQDVARVDVLVLDDLGAERATDWARDRLHTVVDLRYRAANPILASSNVLPERWAETFGERTASRLVGMSNVVPIAGADRRRQ